MYRLLAIIIVWLVGCTSNNTKENNKVQQRSTPLNFLPLKYDSSKSFMDNIDSGYVHFFTVNNQAFKIEKKKTDSSDIAVFYKKGDGWVENFSDYLEREFEVDDDYNSDHYNDFANELRKENVIYLYNKTEKRFEKNPIWLSWDSKLLNSNKVIYYNSYTGSNIVTDYCSVFQIKDLKETTLYKLSSDFDSINSNLLNYTVYKIKNDTLEILQTEFQSKLTIQNFDYETFWCNYLKNKTIVLKTKND